MRRIFYIISLLIAVALFPFCKKDVGQVNYGNYPNEIGKIFTLKCATSGCHNDASFEAASGLNLSTWEHLFEGSTSGSPVIPYRSDFSSLCYFINTYSDLGPVNLPAMPVGGNPLSRYEVQTIKTWINNGAPDVNGNIKWADDPNRKKLYAVNQGCDVVTVFDATSKLPMRFINVGNNPSVIEVPHMVKVSPDGQFWYVLFTNNNILQKFRCSDDVLVGTANIGANFDWNTFVITDDGSKAFCVAWAPLGHVASVDLNKMKLIRNYPLTPFPHGIALNATNDTIYIAAQTGNFIFQMDTAFNNLNQFSAENGIPVNTSSSLDIHEILLSPDKQSFYLTCQKTDELRVFNIAGKTVTNVINTGVFPQEMAVSPVKNKLFVSCTEDQTSFPGAYGSVSVIDLNTFTEQRIQVGYLPHGLAVDEKNNTVFVASRNIFTTGPAPHHTAVCNGRNGFVSFIDLTTLQVSTKRTEISVDPYSLGIRK